MIKYTIISSIRPKRLSKAFELSPDGSITKRPGGQLELGELQVREVCSLAEFAADLRKLGPHQALIYGVPKNKASKVASRQRFAIQGQPNDVTTRTNDAFEWSENGGIFFLDYDPPKGETALEPSELIARLKCAVPELGPVELLWWASASSCIFKGSELVHGIRGQRLYFAVKDAADIPRAGKALVDRLWLAGFGRYEVSKSGQLLERTLIDGSVFQSCRLDFAGGAHCLLPLRQERGDPILHEGSVGVLDTQGALAPLSADDEVKLRQLKAEAKAKVERDAQRVRAQWLSDRQKEILTSDEVQDSDRVARVREALSAALDLGILAGDFVLTVEIDGCEEQASVAQILSNRDKYHGAQTKDPIEPEYDGGRATGKLFLLQAKPVLHSFARGGASYLLQRPLHRVEVVEGRMTEAVDETIRLLREDPLLYDFGADLVMVVDGRLCALDEDSLAYCLGGMVQHFKTKRTGASATQQNCNPPRDLVKQILALGDRRRLKRIEGVITGPIVRPDGSLLTQQGYDPVTGLFLDLLGSSPVTVPIHPTREQALAALNELMLPFRSFPFDHAKARGAHLAAMLTTVVRPALATCPAFGYDAPVQGSGKTLLAQCVGTLAEGRAPDLVPHTKSRDDEEVRKRIFAASRSGARVLVWDNVTGVFDSASMAAFITSQTYSDRVLGKSEMVRLPNRTLVVLTGNNLTLAGDLPRRVVVCRIDPALASPISRQFEWNPLNEVILRRTELLSAACILIRYQLNQSKQWGGGRTASFEDWDRLIRQTVCMANCELAPGQYGDPMELLQEAQLADPESDGLYLVLDAIRQKFGASWFAAKDVCEVAKQSHVFDEVGALVRDALADQLGDMNRRSPKGIGHWLMKRKGRVVNGLRLLSRKDASKNGCVYAVEEVKASVDETKSGKAVL